MIEPKFLHSLVADLPGFPGLDSTDVDVVLDFEYVGNDQAEVLRATATEALQAIHRVGRNAGGAIAVTGCYPASSL